MRGEKAGPDAEHESERMQERRAMLKRILRAGLYVAPIVAVMGMRNLAAAQGSPPMPPH